MKPMQLLTLFCGGRRLAFLSTNALGHAELRHWLMLILKGTPRNPLMDNETDGEHLRSLFICNDSF